MVKSNLPRSFGIEEEYLLLDAATGTPVNRASKFVSLAPELGERTEHEFFASQIETATPICHEAEEAEGALTRFRAVVSREARSKGVVLAGTGLPPLGGDTAGTIAPKARYRRLEAETRAVAEHQYATGLHVHVEVPSPDAGVEVLARLARWAPTLLALTVNSPLWCGGSMGFASWRHVMGLTWPVVGYPLGFEDGDDYRASVEQLVHAGIVPDTGFLTWVARLSENYPTVELRIADAQLDPSDSVAFAVIIRSLVERALMEWESGVERPSFAPSLVNGANWMAARDGLSAELIDPVTVESLPAFDSVERMLETIESELDRCGDRPRVDQYLQRLRQHGSPASRQLAAFGECGVAGLIDLYGNAHDLTAAAA